MLQIVVVEPYTTASVELEPPRALTNGGRRETAANRRNTAAATGEKGVFMEGKLPERAKAPSFVERERETH